MPNQTTPGCRDRRASPEPGDWPWIAGKLLSRPWGRRRSPGRGGGCQEHTATEEEARSGGTGIGSSWKHCFQRLAPVLPDLNSLIINNLIQEKRVLEALEAGNISREEKKSGVKVAGRNKRARGLVAFHYKPDDIFKTASNASMFCKLQTMRGIAWKQMLPVSPKFGSVRSWLASGLHRCSL